MQLSANFHSDEFACKCGCGLANISNELVKKLQFARDMANTGFVITSGLRCPSHNKKEGGLASSAHLKGFAVDIATPDSLTRQIILSGLFEAGFTRIGISKSFIHVDVDKTKPGPACWLY